MPDEVTSDLLERQARGAFRALVRSGEDLIARAIPLTPLELGPLRASYELTIIVNRARFEGPGAHDAALAVAVRLARAGELDRLDVEVSVNQVYAARQHEETEWNHPLGGQAKYLEQPFRENASRYMRALELESELAIRRPA